MTYVPTPLRLLVPLSVTPPVLLIVPLLQLNGPFTEKLPAPLNVAPSRLIAPLLPTVLAAFSVRVFALATNVCVPLVPPSVRLPTVALALSVTV